MFAFFIVLLVFAALQGAATTTIVIPAYNEEMRLPVAEIAQFVAQQNKIQILLVNDGSTDNTLRVLESLAASSPQKIFVLNLENNVGKAEAVRLGMLHAAEGNSAVKQVGFWDADLATPLEAVHDFIQVLRDEGPKIEMVFGARVALLGRKIERHLTRHYLGRVFATLASHLLGLPVYDTQCGAKLFRVTPALKRILQKPFMSRWVFDVELIARVLQERPGSVIYEFPLKEWRDVAGSKISFTDKLGALQGLFDIWRAYY